MSGKAKGKKILKQKKFIERNILSLLSREQEPMNYHQLSHRMGIDDAAGRNIVLQCLVEMENRGILEVPEKGKFRLCDVRRNKFVTGKIEMTISGAAYVLSGNEELDVFIPPGNTGNAFHEDTVKAEIYGRKKNGKPVGRVVAVTERIKTEFTGIISIERNYAIVKSDNEKYPDFYIPIEKTGSATSGDKVIVHLTGWQAGRNPEGEVASVLGEPGDQTTEMHAIMTEYGLPFTFSEKTEREADAIPVNIPDHALKQRRDFRMALTFTIDPEDAKDFDDALSIVRLPNGNWEIGVHIADVSHYVREGTNIDREARLRATSVYLVDRVVPMLPEKLSNTVCSLVPDEDRLTFSAVFEMNHKGDVINTWFGKSIIRSKKRFNYEEAQNCLDSGAGVYYEELKILDDLAKKLRAKRVKKGAIGFDTMEVKFRLDENGHPESVYLKEMKDSNRLIEDFMLLANRSVAELFGKDRGHKRSASFIYRVHPQPKEEKVKEFAEFIHLFGHRINAKNPRDVASAINRLLETVSGTPEENIITSYAVRTMEKAYYTVKNIGHYGLAFDHYTHFTSPIRRYPDLAVHRLLDRHLNKNDFSDPAPLEALSKHCSVQEKKAQRAEWDSVKYMQIKMLQDKIGEEFEGIVSGITEWGMYVEITEYKCEGMIRLKSLRDDYYYFDAKTKSITGLRKKRKFHIGSRVTVLLLRADLAKRQIDLVLV